MNYLINFLLANLIPLIIVVSVVLRIYKGIKSASDARRGTVPTPVREAEEQDEEEEAGEEDRDRGDAVQPRFYLAESAPPRQIRQMAQTSSLVPLPELRPLEPAASGLIKEAALRPAGLQAEPLSASRRVPASPTGTAAPALFRRIGALRPMQQALVLSEILGPPRGMNP